MLGVHDFGQALLADMDNSPHLRKGGDVRITSIINNLSGGVLTIPDCSLLQTPIILIAHSMGGLVAKKVSHLHRWQ